MLDNIVKQSYDTDVFLSITLDVLCVLDSDNKIIYINCKWKEKLGYDTEEVMGMSFMDYVSEEDHHFTQWFIRKIRQNRNSKTLTNRLSTKSDSQRWFVWNGACDQDGLLYLIGDDVTKRKMLENNLQTKAYSDYLTHLPNRDAFSASLKSFIARGNRHKQEFALAFIDVNKFKVINDSFGHSIGDKLLRTIASRLQASIREGDVIGRFGGDEFVVILAGDGAKESYETAIQRMMVMTQQPITIADIDLEPRISVGIALFPECGTNVESLLQQADKAMYLAKKQDSGYYFLPQ